jgi:F0F1-type ATP synthase epsilon subunit
MSINVKPEDLLSVTIKSRKELIFEGKAYSVTSYNEIGFFDVLPFHTNFVTLIRDFVVIDKGLPTEKSVQLEKGIVTVISNTVKVYVGI